MKQSYQTYGGPNPQMTAPPHTPSPQPHACAGHGTQPPAAGSSDPTRPLHHPHENAYLYQYDGPEYGYSPTDQTLPAPVNGIGSWFEFSNSGYLKGFLIGAGVTLLLTNAAVQKTLVRSTVKLWSVVQGGVEEVKEQFQDVKAEMSQEK